MPDNDQREAQRVPFEAPARILVADRWVDAATVDLSRRGVRLRVPADALRLRPPLDLAEAAHAVQRELGMSFRAELRFDVLGPLLGKTVTLVRLCLPPTLDAVLDLGCIFEIPLSPDEAGVLGVPIPDASEKPPIDPLTGSPRPPKVRRGAPRSRPMDPPPPAPDVRSRPRGEPQASEGRTEEATAREQTAGEVATDAAGPLPPPKKRLRAIIAATGTKDPPPRILCRTTGLSRDRIRVCLKRGVAGLDDTGHGVTGATLSITERYGTVLLLRLLEGGAHVWTGATRICEIEIDPDEPDDVHLTLSFNRMLRRAELLRLGLRQTA